MTGQTCGYLVLFVKAVGYVVEGRQIGEREIASLSQGIANGSC